MPNTTYTRPTKSLPPPANPLLAPQPPLAPLTPPVHVIDLMTEEGSAVFGARWKGLEAKLIEVPALSDSRPEFKSTYDVEPHAELLGYDDSTWDVVPATDLGGRRGGGMISFFWYRATLTIPAEAMGFATDGTKAVLRINVDDYAEIWVNGVIPGRSGYPRPAAISGHNMPNRLVLSTGLKPGDKFLIAIFGINGPISMAPANAVFVREAKLELFK